MQSIHILAPHAHGRGVQQHGNGSGGAVVHQQVFVLGTPAAVAIVVVGRKDHPVGVAGNPQRVQLSFRGTKPQRRGAEPPRPSSGRGAEALGGEVELQQVAGLDAAHPGHVAPLVDREEQVAVGQEAQALDPLVAAEQAHVAAVEEPVPSAGRVRSQRSGCELQNVIDADDQVALGRVDQSLAFERDVDVPLGVQGKGFDVFVVGSQPDVAAVEIHPGRN